MTLDFFLATPKSRRGNGRARLSYDASASAISVADRADDGRAVAKQRRPRADVAVLASSPNPDTVGLSGPARAASCETNPPSSSSARQSVKRKSLSRLGHAAPSTSSQCDRSSMRRPGRDRSALHGAVGAAHPYMDANAVLGSKLTLPLEQSRHLGGGSTRPHKGPSRPFERSRPAIREDPPKTQKIEAPQKIVSELLYATGPPYKFQISLARCSRDWSIGLFPARGSKMDAIDCSGVRGWCRGAFKKRTNWFGLLFLVIWTLFVAGCGGDDTTTTPPADTDSGSDARQDTGSDATSENVVVPPDARSDGDAATSDGAKADGEGGTVVPDATPDVTSDRAPDAVVVPDATPDRGPDTSVPDATPDRGPDATADVRPDVVTMPETGAPDADAGPPTLTSITVTPPNVTIPQLTSQPYAATGHYSNGATADLTGAVAWTSSQTTIATINVATGLATATNSTGTTTITATLGQISGSTQLTVSLATLVSIAVTPNNNTIAPTTTQDFVATGTYNNGSTQILTNMVMWTSSVPGVASIDVSTGVATGVVTGLTLITASYQGISGQAALHVQAVNIISIAVTPGTPSIPKGVNQTFKAVATFDDASTQDITTTAVWDSSVPATATVSATGVATSVAPGTTIISASKGTVTGLATLDVTPAELVQIVVTPGQDSIADGTQRIFKATGIYTDNSQQDLTVQAAWVSSDTSVATIANGPNDGAATAVDPGDTAITATYLGVTGTAVLHVTTAVLSQIQVTPPTKSIANGTTQQFTATGIYTDSHTQDLTNSVVWTSNNGAVATVDAVGLATGHGVGTAIIGANQGGITGAALLTITDATLVSIAITPTAPSTPNGLTVQFTAIGTYTDSTTQNLTSTASWSSTLTNIATINGNGLALSDNVGQTTIKATKDGIDSNLAVLTVTDGVLQSITVTPSSPSIPDGVTQQYQADGHYSDGSTVNITTQVTWTSSNTAAATVVPNSGLAQAVDPGFTVIKAASGDITGVATLTVTTAVLSSITVAPANPCIANSSNQQFIATGHFTDNSSINLTGVATWASSVGALASISNANPTRGVATAAASGSGNTTISAAYNPGTGLVTGSTNLHVGAGCGS